MLMIGFLMTFKAGYRLDKQRRLRAKSNHPVTETRAYWETTGSEIKNINVTKNPTEIPIAPLIKVTRRTSVRIIFKMVLGLAPKALMMLNSCC